MKGFCLLLPIVLLSACGKPTFEFRGYSDISSCTDVVDAEVSLGAQVIGTNKADYEESLTLTEMKVEIQGASAIAYVECDQFLKFRSIQYFVKPEIPLKLPELYDRLHTEMSRSFGIPRSTSGERIDRQSSFRCGENGVVWMSENIDDEWLGYSNVELGICPACRVC